MEGEGRQTGPVDEEWDERTKTLGDGRDVSWTGRGNVEWVLAQVGWVGGGLRAG